MIKLSSIIEQNMRLQMRYMNTIVAKQKQTPAEHCLQLVRYLYLTVINIRIVQIKRKRTIFLRI